MLYLVGIFGTKVFTCTGLLMRVARPSVVETRTPGGACLRGCRKYLTQVLMEKSKPDQQCVTQGTACGRPKVEHYKLNRKLNQIRYAEHTRIQPQWLVWPLLQVYLEHISHLCHARYGPCPSHSLWFLHLKYIYWRMQVVRLLITQFSLHTSTFSLISWGKCSFLSLNSDPV